MNVTAITCKACQLLDGIERKSWWSAVNGAHACLGSLPSPAWKEEVPGVACYGPGERELCAAIEAVRRTTMMWMMALTDGSRSWEADDEWPEPNGLRAAVEGLKSFVPQENACGPA